MSDMQLTLILQSGEFDRIHYGLMMAVTAAALDKKVTLFITNAACLAFAKHDRWRNLPISLGMQHLAQNAGTLDTYYQAQHIASFDSLKESALALDVEWKICESGLRAMGLSIDDLDPEIPFVAGGLVGVMHHPQIISI